MIKEPFGSVISRNRNRNLSTRIVILVSLIILSVIANFVSLLRLDRKYSSLL